MTNDYKENILKFITGNLPESGSSYDPRFDNVETTTNNLYNQIKSYFSSRVAYVDFVPSKNNKNQNLEYSVIACRGTLNDEAEESGAFVILDRDYNIVQIITHYSNNSLIGTLYCLNVDEKGNFYAVENVGSNYRIVLLNNLVLKPVGSNTYQAIIIETYNIPNQYTWDSMLKVFKNDGGSKYFVVGSRSNNDGIVGCELTIGDTNTWKYYTSSYTKQWLYAMFDNGYNVYWDSNSELHFQIAVNDYGLVMLSKGSGTAMATTRYTTSDKPNQNGNFIFYSNKIGYYAFCLDSDPIAEFYIYRIDLELNFNECIYESTGSWASYSAIWLFKNINSVYYFKINLVVDDDYELSFGLIDGFGSYEIQLGTFTATNFLEAFCYANAITDFNKNYIYIQNQNTLFSLDFIWNSNNYNGEPYISSASLIPNTITIEDENETEIFNRNIYNLSHYSNWYIASTQIPNYYLNNQSLFNAQLYSQNNNLLATGNINTNKNIYEELIINFINKFRVIDNINENITASSNLTNSIVERITSIKLNKYRINYKDNTNEIKSISTNDLVYDDLSTTYKIVVYVDKLINTIDLISEDETTIYKTIDCSSLETNKYYLISQDLRIE